MAGRGDDPRMWRAVGSAGSKMAARISDARWVRGLQVLGGVDAASLPQFLDEGEQGFLASILLLAHAKPPRKSCPGHPGGELPAPRGARRGLGRARRGSAGARDLACLVAAAAWHDLGRARPGAMAAVSGRLLRRGGADARTHLTRRRAGSGNQRGGDGRVLPAPASDSRSERRWKPAGLPLDVVAYERSRHEQPLAVIASPGPRRHHAPRRVKCAAICDSGAPSPVSSDPVRGKPLAVVAITHAGEARRGEQALRLYQEKTRKGERETGGSKTQRATACAVTRCFSWLRGLDLN